MRPRQHPVHRRAVRALSDELKTISVHHESVAGFMADVYYRVSGRPTATFTSCGPGSANLPISLGNAFLDSVPFLAVTGNVPTSQFNRGAFQEMYRHYQADFPVDGALLLQEGVPADARRDGAAGGAAGLEDDDDGPARACRARRALRRLHGSQRPKKRRTRKPGTPIYRAAAAPIRKAWSRLSTCCSAPTGRRSSSARACAMAARRRNC